jgi:hypothetical protein
MRRVGIQVTALLSVVLVVLGIAVLVETALVGGGVGFALGALFVAAGSLRLYLTRRV